MNKITSDTVQEALSYVTELLENKLAPGIAFHTEDHTRDVLAKSITVGEKCGFTKDELYVLSVAAIFHDTGYINNYKDHEKLSSKIADEFLSQRNIEPALIEQVKKAISATEVPQNPGDKISEALCDADLMHLSGDDYFKQMELLREEWKLTGREVLSELDFHKQSLDFFNRHSYHTKYGKSVLDNLKQENLRRIKEKIAALSE